jgi:hypothetical protein
VKWIVFTFNTHRAIQCPALFVFYCFPIFVRPAYGIATSRMSDIQRFFLADFTNGFPPLRGMTLIAVFEFNCITIVQKDQTYKCQNYQMSKFFFPILNKLL